MLTTNLLELDEDDEKLELELELLDENELLLELDEDGPASNSI